MRRLAVLLTALLTAFLAGAPPAAGRLRPVASAPAAPTAPLNASPVVNYRLPFLATAAIVHPYDAPASPYAAGERGVDFASFAGMPVLAAGAGVVTFAGSVAGRGVVVIAHPDGMSTEYEPVTASVARGQRVAAGDQIGLVAGLHLGCAVDACLHWGARRGQLYIDPLSLLMRLGPVRLLPWD